MDPIESSLTGIAKRFGQDEPKGLAYRNQNTVFANLKIRFSLETHMHTHMEMSDQPKRTLQKSQINNEKPTCSLSSLNHLFCVHYLLKNPSMSKVLFVFLLL